MNSQRYRPRHSSVSGIVVAKASRAPTKHTNRRVCGLIVTVQPTTKMAQGEFLHNPTASFFPPRIPLLFEWELTMIDLICVRDERRRNGAEPRPDQAHGGLPGRAHGAALPRLPQGGRTPARARAAEGAHRLPREDQHGAMPFDLQLARGKRREKRAVCSRGVLCVCVLQVEALQDVVQELPAGSPLKGERVVRLHVLAAARRGGH